MSDKTTDKPVREETALSKAESPAELALQLLNQQLQIVTDPGQLDTAIAFPHEVRDDGYTKWSQGLTHDQRVRAYRVMETLRKGSYANLPIICKGAANCIHGHICPFAGAEPLKQQCPVEKRLIADKLQNYMTDYAVTPLMTSLYALVNRLVALDIFDYRFSSMASSERYQSLVVDAPKGCTPQGDLYGTEEISGIIPALETISRERMKIMTELVGTPREKYKKQAALQQSDGDTYSEKSAQLSRLLHRFERQLDKMEDGKKPSPEVVVEPPQPFAPPATIDVEDVEEVEDEPDRGEWE